MKLKYSSVFFLILSTLDNKAFTVEPTRVLVVNTQDASVSLVDLVAMKEIKRIPVGKNPYGVAVSRDQNIFVIGVEGEEGVRFFDTSSFKPMGFIKIGKMKNDHISLTTDGKYFVVANYFSNNIIAIDVKRQKVAYHISGLSGPHVVKFGPQKKNAYVTCKKVTGLGIIDVEQKKARFIPLNVNPRSLTFSPDESRVYFASFWVDGFFEMDPILAKVTRLIKIEPPSDNSNPQEVTYHGVEAVTNNVVLAANEGRSFIDAVDVHSGKLTDRLTGASKPCCIEHIPGSQSGVVKALVSNIGNSTLEIVSLTEDGKLKSTGKVSVGAVPKRVAFLN